VLGENRYFNFYLKNNMLRQPVTFLVFLNYADKGVMVAEAVG
jgi:hypothetical protein